MSSDASASTSTSATATAESSTSDTASEGESTGETGGSGPCHPAHDAATPALTGEYCVGVSILHLVDENREETFTSDPNDLREVLVYLFYPILEGSDRAPAPWIGEKEWPWLLNYGFPLPDDGYVDLWSNAVENEVVAPGSFPLVTFMAGWGAHTSPYTAVFIEPLVSRGFIVAAVNHPHMSGIVNFPDGRSVEASAPLNHETFAVAIGDVRFVIDELETLGTRDPEWQEKVNFEQVGSFGHSYGGITSSELLVQDDRFLAAINYDGSALFGDVREVGTSKPMMLVASEEGGLNPSSGNWGNLWSVLSGPAYYGWIAGTTHVGISDIGLLVEHFDVGSPGSLGAGTIEPTRLHELASTLTWSFFAAHVQGGDPAGVIESLESFREISSVEVKN